VSIVPFLEIGIFLCRITKTSETTRFTRPAQRARQHNSEAAAFQESSDFDRILLTVVGQWKIRSSRMLPGEAPFGFSMTHKPQLGTFG
jgi:hypothetical protein